MLARRPRTRLKMPQVGPGKDQRHWKAVPRQEICRAPFRTAARIAASEHVSSRKLSSAKGFRGSDLSETTPSLRDILRGIIEHSVIEDVEFRGAKFQLIPTLGNSKALGQRHVVEEPPWPPCHASHEL
jgi:hypothetical protein